MVDGNFSVVAEQTNLFLIIAALIGLAWLDNVLRRFLNVLMLRGAYLKRSIVKVNYLGERLSQLGAISRTHFSSIRAEVDPVECSVHDTPFSLADDLSFVENECGTFEVRISLETQVACIVQVVVASSRDHLMSFVVGAFEAARNGPLSRREEGRTRGSFLAVSKPTSIEGATAFTGVFDVASPFLGNGHGDGAERSTCSVGIVLRTAVVKAAADSIENRAPKHGTGLVGHIKVVNVAGGINTDAEAQHDLRVKTGKEILNVTSDGTIPGTTIFTCEEIWDSAGDGEDSLLCVICLTEPRDTVLLPCRHLCVCSDCFPRLSKCPICRSSFREWMAVK